MDKVKKLSKIICEKAVFLNFKSRQRNKREREEQQMKEKKAWVGKRVGSVKIIMVIIFGMAVCLFPMKASAEEWPATRAILAYTNSYAMGTVSGTLNGVSFQGGVYASNYDSIAISATPYSGYSFAYWTDNGVIVSKSAYYTFNPGFYDHTIVGHFVKRSDNDDDDEDEIPQLNWSNTACIFAPGHKVTATSVTTAQVTQGVKCQEAFDSVLEDYSYVGTYNISFAHAGKPLEKLEGPAHLIFDIPAQYQKPYRKFRMLRVYKGQPAVLEDLDNLDNKVTFESDATAAYALVYKDEMR